MPKIMFFTSLLPCFKVMVKGRGQGQRSGSRSILGAQLCRVQQNRSHYQSKVIVCMSVISRRVRLIARMRSIGF